MWRTFGLAIGIFVFSVTAALVIGNDSKVSVIVPVAEVAGVLAALAMIRTLQVKAFTSIQLAPTLSAIAAQGRGILDDLYLRPDAAGESPAAPLPPLRRAVTWPGRQAICSKSTCPGCSLPPPEELSSCSAPASATRSRKAPWSPTCMAARPTTQRSWARW